MRTRGLGVITAVGLALSALATSGCGNDAVDLKVDVVSQELWLRAETVNLTIHPAEPNVSNPQDTTSRLEIQLQGSGFEAPPIAQFGPFTACEFGSGVELPNLPRALVHYCVDIRIGADLIAFDCSPVTLDELPVSTSTGLPEIRLKTRATTRYNTVYATQPAMWSSLTEKCGTP